jgi:hypothetical protein
MRTEIDMGIFWNYADPAQRVEELFTSALAGPSLHGEELQQQAQILRTAAAASPGTQATLNLENLAIALLLVVAFVGAGIGTNAVGLTDSTTALFALATTAFGIVVGLLTGEKP